LPYYILYRRKYVLLCVKFIYRVVGHVSSVDLFVVVQRQLFTQSYV